MFTTLTNARSWTTRFYSRAVSKSLVTDASVTSKSAALSSTFASGQAARVWRPPALGVNPAYDEALKIIALNKSEKLGLLKEIDKKIIELPKAGKPDVAGDLVELQKRRFDLQVEAEINDPEVQWNFKNDIVDMSRPVYRFMRQQRFENEFLPILMERVTQMNVLPDLLPPSFVPSVELGIKFNDTDSVIEPGVFVEPMKAFDAPNLFATCFHVEERLYSILMVDPDVPDPENLTYQQQCHWLVTNIPLSATDSLLANKGNVVLPYLPPHPAKGSAKYHRYTIILLEQPNNGKERVKINGDFERLHFDTTEFRTKHNFIPCSINFFREKWDVTVSEIYEKLGIREPIFGREPKADLYLDETGRKRRRYLTV